MKNIEVKITIPESEWSKWYDAELGVDALLLKQNSQVAKLVDAIQA